LFWIGWQYADLGFFADAAEALGELCSRFNDAEARRLLAEVVWWRDNTHRIPWIPPDGDGSRYDRMMDFIDPAAPMCGKSFITHRPIIIYMAGKKEYTSEIGSKLNTKLSQTKTNFSRN